MKGRQAHREHKTMDGGKIVRIKIIMNRRQIVGGGRSIQCCPRDHQTCWVQLGSSGQSDTSFSIVVRVCLCAYATLAVCCAMLLLRPVVCWLLGRAFFNVSACCCATRLPLPYFCALRPIAFAHPLCRYSSDIVGAGLGSLRLEMCGWLLLPAN